MKQKKQIKAGKKAQQTAEKDVESSPESETEISDVRLSFYIIDVNTRKNQI